MLDINFITILIIETLSECVTNCNCETGDYNPICIKELGLNFPSACAAGCKDFKVDANKKVTYENCNCIKKKINNTFGLSPGHPLISQRHSSFKPSKNFDCFRVIHTGSEFVLDEILSERALNQ